MKDIEQVFSNDKGPEGLAQELSLYRNYGFSLGDLPAGRRVTIWHGLTDNIVPPAMAWKMVQAFPDAEAHFLPGGHFMAIDAAGLIIDRLGQQLDGRLILRFSREFLSHMHAIAPYCESEGVRCCRSVRFASRSRTASMNFLGTSERFGRQNLQFSANPIIRCGRIPSCQMGHARIRPLIPDLPGVRPLLWIASPSLTCTCRSTPLTPSSSTPRAISTAIVTTDIATFTEARDAALSSIEIMLDEEDYDGEDHREELERMLGHLESSSSYEELERHAAHRRLVARLDPARSAAA